MDYAPFKAKLIYQYSLSIFHVFRMSDLEWWLQREKTNILVRRPNEPIRTDA